MTEPGTAPLVDVRCNKCGDIVATVTRGEPGTLTITYTIREKRQVFEAPPGYVEPTRRETVQHHPDGQPYTVVDYVHAEGAAPIPTCRQWVNDTDATVITDPRAQRARAKRHVQQGHQDPREAAKQLRWNAVVLRCHQHGWLKLTIDDLCTPLSEADAGMETPRKLAIPGDKLQAC